MYVRFGGIRNTKTWSKSRTNEVLYKVPIKVGYTAYSVVGAKMQAKMVSFTKKDKKYIEKYPKPQPFKSNIVWKP